MKGIKKFNKGLQCILQHQCDVVGVDPEKIDFKSDNWYSQWTWTREEEEQFESWMLDELMEHKWLREFIMEHPRKDKKHAKKCVQAWIFQYRWVTVEE